MHDVLSLIGRSEELFNRDIEDLNSQLVELVRDHSFLVIGGAGSIGQAVVKELFQRKPKVLHVVDISENSLVELIRDIRSSLGYIQADFRTFVIDCGSINFEFFLRQQGPYDYVLNLSAIKHVRNEKDPYSLMRMIEVNVLNTEAILNILRQEKTKKYFSVSTDKATNPVSMMGATKRVMEILLMAASRFLPVSTSRFANVAFSDGSLLHGFGQRIAKRQPLTAPMDIKRYFMTDRESGQLCLLSCLLGHNRDIFFPKLDKDLDLLSFADLAENYLQSLGWEPYHCKTEDEARIMVNELSPHGQWPCFFVQTDTSGEKEIEEFYTWDQELDMDRFADIGVIKNPGPEGDLDSLRQMTKEIRDIQRRGYWEKQELIDIFESMLPEFSHMETGRYLDDKM